MTYVLTVWGADNDLCVVPDSRGWLTFILFVARGIISGVFQAAYVYTPEVSVSWFN